MEHLNKFFDNEHFRERDLIVANMKKPENLTYYVNGDVECLEHGKQPIVKDICEKCVLATLNAVERKTNCDIHGEQDIMLDDTCVMCYQEKKAKEQSRRDAIDEEGLFNVRHSKSNIPPRFQRASFDNYNVSSSSKQLHFLDKMKSYKFNSHILMTGHSGNGKTHLACAMLNNAMRHKHDVFYTNMKEINKLECSKDKLEQVKYQYLLTCKILVIDEFGLSNTTYKEELLQDVIDNRYMKSTKEKELFTCIISNIANDNLKKFILDSTRSRLIENLIQIETDWGDYRRQK